jgi:hypothetical protein
MSQNEATNNYIFSKGRAAFYAVKIKIVLEFIEQEIVMSGVGSVVWACVGTDQQIKQSFVSFK